MFEGSASFVAFREFGKFKGNRKFLEAVRESKGPTTFTVLYEDSTAVPGLIVAFFGVFLGHARQIPKLDGLASLVVGIILCGTASFLVYESKGLLIGEGIAPRTRADLARNIEDDPDVDQLVRALSLHLGPKDVLVRLEVRFRCDETANELVHAIDQIDKAIRAAHREIHPLFLEAHSIAEQPKPSPN